jgi:hypothetical protein
MLVLLAYLCAPLFVQRVGDGLLDSDDARFTLQGNEVVPL